MDSDIENSPKRLKKDAEKELNEEELNGIKNTEINQSNLMRLQVTWIQIPEFFFTITLLILTIA